MSMWRVDLVWWLPRPQYESLCVELHFFSPFNLRDYPENYRKGYASGGQTHSYTRWSRAGFRSTVVAAGATLWLPGNLLLPAQVYLIYLIYLMYNISNSNLNWVPMKSLGEFWRGVGPIFQAAFTRVGYLSFIWKINYKNGWNQGKTIVCLTFIPSAFPLIIRPTPTCAWVVIAVLTWSPQLECYGS